MTTIAWDGKTLAADSKLTRGGAGYGGTCFAEQTLKLSRSKEGHLGAWAGIYNHQCDRFLEWVRKGCKGDPVQPSTDTAFILVEPNGQLHEFRPEGISRTVPGYGYMAWGSGRDFAIGALAMGATAVEAVKIAARHDLATGGPVRSGSLVKSR